MKISQNLRNRLVTFSLTLLVTVIFGVSIEAQTNSVDLSFNAVPDKNATTATNFILQPDNKIVAFGDFQVARGAVKSRIARFNPDGSVDNSFNCAICDFPIISAVAQPDGKIIIAGGTSGVIGQSRLFRLNTDGSLDGSFTSPFPVVVFPETNTTDVQAVQPDGKILVILIRRSSNSYNYTLNRLNTDGTIDNTFTPILVAAGSGGIFGQNPGKIVLLPNGKILAVTNSFANCPGCTPRTGVIKRYNADGSIDSAFEPPVTSIPGSSGGGAFITDFDVNTDGSLIIVGIFTSVNGVNRSKIAKIQPAGNVDLTFNSPLNLGFTRVIIQSDGKILLSITNQIYRLNVDGSADSSFVSPASITSIYDIKFDSAGSIVLHALFIENGVPVNKFVRLNQNGGIESSFEPYFGIVGSTTAIAAQPDGKIVFAGDFLRVNGVSKASIARVNADGSLDPTFNPGTGVNANNSTGGVSKILIQSDGKILLAGTIFSYNGASLLGLIRVNSDGSLDTGFNPTITFVSFISISSVVLQNDGKIIIVGNFNAVNGQPRTGIARLNADGSLDASFNPTFGSYSIIDVFAQADGRLLVGGTFSGVNGFSRTNLVRLNADGSLDSSFNAGNIARVNQIEVQPDGKYLVSTSTLLRLNNNGAVDATFLSPSFQSANSNNPLIQFLAQPDGTILVGGDFASVNGAPRLNIARLRPNGSLDTTFLPGGANAPVRTIVRQPDGRILVGGDFSVIGGVARLSIARLNVAPFRIITPFDYDGDGRADVSVFRPSDGVWYLLNSTSGFSARQFGQSGDRLAPADYDGDGRTDLAVFREPAPGAGDQAYFYVFNSADNSFRAVGFGTSSDVPLSGDWDGDGRADLAVYRAAQTAGGQSYFYYRPSSQPNVDYLTLPLGTQGDKAVLGDFDGDGRIDPALFRPTADASGAATWIIWRSSMNQITQTSFGLPTDVPTPADFDGDGATNIAVFRPSTGTWYTSTNPANYYGAIQFGASGDAPVAADYDGDGRADVAVFRPSSGAWYLNRTTSGFTGVAFGTTEDKPIPNAFIR